MKTLVLTILAVVGVFLVTACNKDLVVEPQKEIVKQDTTKAPSITDSIGQGGNGFGEF